jgi:hypothetical protein
MHIQLKTHLIHHKLRKKTAVVSSVFSNPPVTYLRSRLQSAAGWPYSLGKSGNLRVQIVRRFGLRILLCRIGKSMPKKSTEPFCLHQSGIVLMFQIVSRPDGGKSSGQLSFSMSIVSRQFITFHKLQLDHVFSILSYSLFLYFLLRRTEVNKWKNRRRHQESKGKENGQK